MPWPEYIKEQRDFIEGAIRENLSCLHDLYTAKRAIEQKEVEIEYCANGHGRIKGDWCDEDIATILAETVSRHFISLKMPFWLLFLLVKK